jgi:hypothetical protein
MKSWKSLFIKDDEEEQKEAETPKQQKSSSDFSFPVTPKTTPPPASSQPAYQPPANTYVPPAPSAAPAPEAMNEVLSVYEKGIESINMPGYDFFEFYKAISSIPNAGDQAYQMAFQMAKSMDSTLTPAKLMGDAEFYVSKINEVHNQYGMQGQEKLNRVMTDREHEKKLLNSDIDSALQKITELRNQIQTLEATVNEKRSKLSGVDAIYQPKEASIRAVLTANDNAHQTSIQRLVAVRDGILRSLK